MSASNPSAKPKTPIFFDFGLNLLVLMSFRLSGRDSTLAGSRESIEKLERLCSGLNYLLLLCLNGSSGMLRLPIREIIESALAMLWRIDCCEMRAE